MTITAPSHHHLEARCVQAVKECSGNRTPLQVSKMERRLRSSNYNALSSGSLGQQRECRAAARARNAPRESLELKSLRSVCVCVWIMDTFRIRAESSATTESKVYGRSRKKDQCSKAPPNPQTGHARGALLPRLESIFFRECVTFSSSLKAKILRATATLWEASRAPGSGPCCARHYW